MFDVVGNDVDVGEISLLLLDVDSDVWLYSKGPPLTVTE